MFPLCVCVWIARPELVDHNEIIHRDKFPGSIVDGRILFLRNLHSAAHCNPIQKRQNITMLVNTLYIDFSDGKLQEYEVLCDAQRKMATVAHISTEERNRLNELARQAENAVIVGGGVVSVEPHDPSDIVFISICVLAVILMVIAVIWLVLL